MDPLMSMSTDIKSWKCNERFKQKCESGVNLANWGLQANSHLGPFHPLSQIHHSIVGLLGKISSFTYLEWQ